MNIEKAKASLQMIGSRVIELNIKNNFVMMDMSKLEKSIDVSYKVGEIDSYENNILIGNVRMQILINLCGEDQKSEIKLVLDAGFELQNSQDEKLMKEMLTVNGTAALYSIARGIISSVTSHMCENGAITIPMLNFYELNDMQQEI